MKIAVITPFLPYKNATHAGGVYTWHLIEHLCKNHGVTLFTRVHKNEGSQLQQINTNFEKIHFLEYMSSTKSSIFKKLSTIISYLYFFKMVRGKLKNQKFDLIQIEYSESTYFLGKLNSKLLLNLHDVVGLRYAREIDNQNNPFSESVSYIKKMMYEFLENVSVRKTNMIFVRTDYEKHYLRTRFPEKKIEVVPLMMNEDANPDPIYSMKENANHLLFTGALDRKYNEETSIYIISEIFSIISRDFPEIKLILGGNNPGDRLKEMAANSENISLTGYVKDFDQLYQSGGIFISPVFSGGGMLYKNLQAMWFGLPVITTTFGNLGINAENGLEVLIANKSSEFIDSIKRLQNKEFYQKISHNGKNLVHRQYNAERVLTDYDNHISDCIHGMD
ncbi:MAG: glycosyltransferase family 4 protein [Candidatus Marinimicrobia bacterium]|jgi:glycosyltransferase involved in cell wall biosynthesis|nr:glycosyltransferase family 4 protein [Candidatus Neomarinimicrobiota bacterium]MBT3759916.1 glycosyltransferase family 4 protein [Candidatus Neomarinimicrobiota bacterium]MBT4537737.1 glycosyltransferase family 4 protein [Candidatus Neomarinimicrobiota bacterium]MBT4853098.1 glycosyltransferase family 4 protein [Candidatus Neomarinimicrobiota bacterium]MBT6216440.1 glycosyltransferase family 4 protein [Candidatus Neomarinimicrobiota bacterium]